MKIEAKMKLEYKNNKYSKIAYKSLEVDNKGFVDSEIKENNINFKIKSDTLSSFLATADDLIASEILVENLIENIKK